jgi:hypothetical protein
MAGGLDSKISALTGVTAVVAAQEVPVNDAGTTKKANMSQIRQYIGSGLSNAATAAVSGAYAADTYLAGSAITIPTAGGWRVGTMYRVYFDMTKTAAGTATFIVQVRMGTLGTTGDASILTLTFAAGTAAIDTGWFELKVIFRTIGAGSAAVIASVIRCYHHLAATGLISTGASGVGILTGTSAGFASTTQTIIGVSVNGGASFAGTTTIVAATADNI